MTRPRLVLERFSKDSRPATGVGSRVIWPRLILIEDNSARAQRRAVAGITSRCVRGKITIRVHRFQNGKAGVVAEKSYRAGELAGDPRRSRKATAALEMLDRLRFVRRGTVVVAGPAYGSSRWFVEGLVARGFDFVVEVRPSASVCNAALGSGSTARAGDLLSDAEWKRLNIAVPGASTPVRYAAADLAEVFLPAGGIGQLFAAETGGIDGVHRGTIFGLTSVREASLKHLLEVVGWARWIRPAVRRQERLALEGSTKRAPQQGANRFRRNDVNLTVRANIMLARRQDQTAAWNQEELPLQRYRSRGIFASLSEVNVVELFAGAGGMGLGFLLASRSRYSLVFSAEVNPIYAATLKRNHEVSKSLRRSASPCVPEEVRPLDLRSPSSLKLIEACSRQAGGTHLLIAGPPCQGFSSANRNSWHSANPHNRLVQVFIRYVEALGPPAFLMENVQGILWTPRNGSSPAQLSVADHLARRFASAGYLVFPKLLDAVWFGVPQYRSRFFLLGLRRDLGYRSDDFGSWGPFPLPTHGPGTEQPYVTVREAIRDLPPVANGQGREVMPYDEPGAQTLKSNAFLRLMRQGAPRALILDHVTSRHADYVIERYRRIPPGGNWEDIAAMLTNYTDVGRTHSNIYRRLNWKEPSITIGHYRKSMLVHPSQHRGLSLREASRLQSFPDWFCFSGTPDGRGGGLVHRQQQLANAVCPLVTKALAEFILRL